MIFVTSLTQATTSRRWRSASSSGRSWLERGARRTARGVLSLAILSLIQLGLGHGANAEEEDGAIVVELDRALLIKLPARGRVIGVDDPLIVRATYLSASNQLVVTGISYGQTRMTVLGDSDKVIAIATIRVKEPADAGVTVYRGQERGTYYDCARQCQPRLQLGDDNKQFSSVAGQIQRNGNLNEAGGAPETPQVASKGGL